jgi:hypothetical protein
MAGQFGVGHEAFLYWTEYLKVYVLVDVRPLTNFEKKVGIAGRFEGAE